MTATQLPLDTDWSINELLTLKYVGTRFQPIISMREKIVVGLEALSFGTHPRTGQRIPPGMLFESAAAEGALLDLDRLCREKALESFSRLARRSELLLWLNIETSILKPEVVGTGWLAETVRRNGLRPDHVVIEIVESAVSDLAALQSFVDRHKAMGFLIALDDVGTGHSSLERIARIKPDIIKIDRFLVRGLEKEYHKREVVRSLADLARGIGALVVAEGVETEDEALSILDLGINIHQGYLYAHPDQTPSDQVNRCTRAMDHLAENFRHRRVSRFERRKTWFATMGETVRALAYDLVPLKQTELGTALETLILDRPDIECLYVLDMDGIQVTETVCNELCLSRPTSLLFRPAPKGADLSLKDYFLLVKAGLPQYFSEPYISRASGNICITVSFPFTTVDRTPYILCADYHLDSSILDGDRAF